jgi:hypothetical protein
MELGPFDKLIVDQLANNFRICYGTRGFISVHKSPILEPVFRQLCPRLYLILI